MNKININDINYLYSNENLNPPFRKEKYKFSLGKIIYNFLRALKKGCIGLFYYFFTRKKCLKNSADYLFFAFTSNNKRALEPIQKKITRSILLECSDLDLKKMDRFILVFIGEILYKCIVSKGYLKKVYVSEFVEFCCTYSYYKNALKILGEINPKLLIIANDHSGLPRSFFRAAQELGIKTAYVQHASVSNNFPPLEFDYAFLDGMESYKKYIFNGKECKSTVFLSGSPRFDNIKDEVKNNDRDILKIGISINLVDSFEKIKYLIQLIKKNSFFEITLRPHPAMDINDIKKITDEFNCFFSDPRIENPFKFINDNDLFISGESSMHLDVVLSNKISLYYNFTNKAVLDWYGYIKDNLIIDISLKPLFYINRFQNNLEGLGDRSEIKKYYIANYSTLYWGKSAELISKTLLSLDKIDKVWNNNNKIYYIRE